MNNIKEPPTPNFVTNAENKMLSESLTPGSTIALDWHGYKMRVTRTLANKIGFYEKDVLSCFAITEENFSEERRNTVKASYGDAFFDKDDPLLILEPALYLYHFHSNTKQSYQFVEWVCSEILPSIRNIGLYVDTKDDSMQSMLSDIRMNYDLLVSRVDKLNANPISIEDLKEDLISSVRKELDVHVTANKEFLSRMSEIQPALESKLDAAVEVFHNSAIPLEDMGKASKSGRPKAVVPYTDSQEATFKILHEQLAAQIGSRKNATSMFTGMFTSLYWAPNKHKYTGNLIKKVGTTIAKGDETTGTVDDLLDVCRKLIGMTGLTPVDLLNWDSVLNEENSDRKYQRVIDNDWGNNLKVIPIEDISLKDVKAP